jgi:glucose-fructose oxidoreductase
LNAKGNSELTALVSDDEQKLRALSKAYKVPHCYTYEEYDECLRSGNIDAVYLSLPNDQHCEFTVRAARAGIHVLSEKPLAMDEHECHEMIRACSRNNVKLMSAYRLHFQEANLEAIKLVQSGKIGDARFFNSTFSMQVKKGIRTQKIHGGGTLYDIGIYCINAARYLFQADPHMVSAFSSTGYDSRFKEIDEMTAATLRFPDKRLATFVCSFGAIDTSMYEVVGTKGRIRLTQAFEFSEPVNMEIQIGDKITHRTFAKTDQFGPELAYFSNCILNDLEPEPSGLEGLIDVHIIRSLYKSARIGRPITLEHFPRHRRPNVSQLVHMPVRKPLRMVNTGASHE